MALIREKLEYEHHMKYDSRNDREMFEEIYETVCDIVCVKRNTIRINGEEYPYELVKSRFLKLNSSHVLYVMDRMRDTTTKITNIRSYLITALYNAPSTMSHYYQQEVQHDMYGGGWEEKGVRQLSFGHDVQRWKAVQKMCMIVVWKRRCRTYGKKEIYIGRRT